MLEISTITQTTLPISAKAAGLASRSELALARAEARLLSHGKHKTGLKLSEALEAACSLQAGSTDTLLTAFFTDSCDSDKNKAKGNACEQCAPSSLEALRKVKALRWASRFISPNHKVTPEIFLDLHSRCLTGRGHHQSGISFRSTQNDKPVFTPLGARREPAPDVIFPLLMELCDFINKDIYSPVVQAAIAQCQFDYIRPFNEESLSTTTLISHLVFFRRRVLKKAVVPLSLLRRMEPGCFDKQHANSKKKTSSPDAGEEARRINAWIALHSGSVELAATSINQLCDIIEVLERSWRGRLGRPSKGSVLEDILELLPAHPILTVETAMQLTGKGFSATNDAIARLVRARILSVASEAHRRTRVFRSTDVIESYERVLGQSLPRFLLTAAFRARLFE